MLKKVDGKTRRDRARILGAVALAASLALGAALAGYSGSARASDCSVYNGDQVGCASHNTCFWDSYSCSAFNGNSTACLNQSPCAYPGNLGDCSGYDESACGLASGVGCSSNFASCSWNGSSCDGGGSCAGYGDEGSCNGATYFSGCSGTYDTGECTGTYEPGTCSGSFDGEAPTLLQPGTPSVNGTTLTLAYNESLNPSSVPSTSDFLVNDSVVGQLGINSVAVTGSDVVLTLASTVTNYSVLTVSYTAGTNPTEDTSGNNAANLSGESVVNNTPDTFAPTFVKARVAGDTVTLTYNENLDTGVILSAESFSVTEGGTPMTVSAASVVGATVVLTLSGSVTTGTEILVSYTAVGPAIQDEAGNDAASLSDELVIRINSDAWAERTGAGLRTWSEIVSSADGAKLAVANYNDVNGYIYTSTDSGANWTARTGPGTQSWQTVTSSSDGAKLAAAIGDGNATAGHIFTSDDSGATWTERTGAGALVVDSLASSADGATLVAAVGVAASHTGYVYISTDSGVTWTEYTGAGLREWRGTAVSSDGTKVAGSANGGFIYTTTLASDTTAPTVLSASSDKAAGSYTVGEVIDIDIQFSEAVTSTGNVTVTLETGTTDRTCTFTVSGAASGTCNYTVQAGDTSADLTVSSITGTVTDAAGNALDVPADLATNLAANEDFVIDTTVPSAPGAPDLLPDYDIGFSATDNITGAVNIYANVACETDTTVYLKTGNTVLGSNTCVDAAAYIEALLPSEGEISLVATQVDAAGNVSATSSALAVTADFTSPTVLSASSTKAAGTYGVGEVIDVDLQFSEAVASYEDIAVTLETGTTDRTCAFTVSNSTYATCDYTVQAGDTSADLTVSSLSGHLEDIAGNDYANSIVSNMADNEAIVIDGVAPSVSLDAPLAAATVSGAAVALSATASDGVSLAGVQFKIDGADEGAEDTSAPYAATWDSTGVADGSHTVAAVARDGAGNYATSSVTVTVDNVTEAAPAPAPAPDSAERHSSSGRASRQSALGNDGGSSGTGAIDGSSGGGGSASPALDRLWEIASRDLEQGATGEDVRALQRWLNAAGFAVAAVGPGSPGEETTLFGPATRAALARFQAASGIVPASGYFGPLTRAAIGGLGEGAAPGAEAVGDLGSVPSPVFQDAARDIEEGSEGADVRALQRLLVERATGPAAAALESNGVSDYFGPLTRAALAELQRALGVSPASGYYGPKTRAALGL